MTFAPEFPRALLREKSHAWNLAGNAVSGGQTSVGQSYATSDGGGFWTCKMSDVSLSGGRKGIDRGRDRQKVSTQLWRAVQMLADGGAGQLVVPRNDALVRPWPPGFAASFGDGVPHDDDSLLDDGSDYYQQVIDIVAAAADLRATSLDISIALAGELLGGEEFSIRHPTKGPRLYRIRTVEMISVDEATITIRPPLREAIEDDTPLEFDRPVCLMRLVSPSSMDLTEQPWTFNSASVDFVEDLRDVVT
ncbi:hypothetical protein PMI42_04874 [Bradyrhizobium sp. YR681]|uniref:hypothetical protein n=1 Tax=Bradyrhizobium sp. YR681 TaxID=1144344 RepID=UPI0002711497|nr:hypothetical protein [Bradyrhizobium sp. YR681]EJN11859.1 hypothetical protein PMI42_04874 [Bradyrhizobium sp. YR681]